MSGILSFCESVTASGRSPWHLRWLDVAGPKFGGGVTTPSLCGHVRARYGWDLEVAITPINIQIACGRCLDLLGKRGSA